MNNLLTSTLQNMPQQRCVMWHAFSLATSMQHVSCTEQKIGQVVILWLMQVTCTGRIKNITTQCVCKITSLQSYPWRKDFLYIELHPYSLFVKAGLSACKITSLQSYPWRQDILSVKLHPYSLTHEGRTFCLQNYILTVLPMKAGHFVCKITSLQFTHEGRTFCL